MTLFRYRAQSPEGDPQEGTMEESSAHRVRLRLQERGLTVVQVDEANPDRRLLRNAQQLSWQELEIFAQQLDSLVKHGLPLPAAFKAMAADVRSARMRPVLAQLHRDLEQGLSLDEAVSRQGVAFPRVFAVLLRAGEAANNLSGVLQMLTTYAGRQVQFTHALRAVLAYPMIVFLACIAVLYYMITNLVPTFASIFEEFGGSLPYPTRFWIRISDSVLQHQTQWGLSLLLLLAGGIVGWQALRRTASGTAWLDAVRLRLPVIGRIYYLLALARFARLLGLLMAARVPILDSLDLSAAGSGSPMLQRAVEGASLRVAGGDRIADALTSSGFFPETFCWLLSLGETRGTAEASLSGLADNAEREAGLRDRAVLTLLGPAMVFLVGLLVLQIVVSLYLPIFTLGDQISGT